MFAMLLYKTFTKESPYFSLLSSSQVSHNMPNFLFLWQWDIFVVIPNNWYLNIVLWHQKNAKSSYGLEEMNFRYMWSGWPLWRSHMGGIYHWKLFLFQAIRVHNLPGWHPLFSWWSGETRSIRWLLCSILVCCSAPQMEYCDSSAVILADTDQWPGSTQSQLWKWYWGNMLQP